MKIVYCIPDTYKPGGIERVTSLKTNYLAENTKNEIIIITTGQSNKKPFYHFSDKIKFYDLGVNYDEMLSENFVKRILIRKQKREEHKKQLTKLLYTLKADIVISTLTHEADFLPKIKDGSKKLLEFHFCKGHKRLMANAFQFPFITKLAYYYRAWIEEKFIIPRYDQFIVLTEEDRNQWIKQIKNVIAIPNILPFECDEKAELQNHKVIAVGRLDSQKGFDRLIDIWKIVSQKHPDWELNIYGEGSDKEALEGQIQRLAIGQTCHINDPVRNIMEKYINSSILVMTSRYEGFGMVLAEAMACGVPCVAYACKCGPKEIVQDSVDGFLLEEEDKDSIANKISLLIQNEKLRKEFGLNAAKNIRRFSVNNIMQQWVELFYTLTNEKNRDNYNS